MATQLSPARSPTMKSTTSSSSEATTVIQHASGSDDGNDGNVVKESLTTSFDADIPSIAASHSHAIPTNSKLPRSTKTCAEKLSVVPNECTVPTTPLRAIQECGRSKSTSKRWQTLRGDTGTENRKSIFNIDGQTHSVKTYQSDPRPRTTNMDSSASPCSSHKRAPRPTIMKLATLERLSRPIRPLPKIVKAVQAYAELQSPAELDLVDHKEVDSAHIEDCITAPAEELDSDMTRRMPPCYAARTEPSHAESSGSAQVAQVEPELDVASKSEQTDAETAEMYGEPFKCQRLSGEELEELYDIVSRSIREEELVAFMSELAQKMPDLVPDIPSWVYEPLYAYITGGTPVIDAEFQHVFEHWSGFFHMTEKHCPQDAFWTKLTERGGPDMTPETHWWNHRPVYVERDGTTQVKPVESQPHIVEDSQVAARFPSQLEEAGSGQKIGVQSGTANPSAQHGQVQPDLDIVSRSAPANRSEHPQQVECGKRNVSWADSENALTISEPSELHVEKLRAIPQAVTPPYKEHAQASSQLNPSPQHSDPKPAIPPHSPFPTNDAFAIGSYHKKCIDPSAIATYQEKCINSLLSTFEAANPSDKLLITTLRTRIAALISSLKNTTTNAQPSLPAQNLLHQRQLDLAQLSALENTVDTLYTTVDTLSNENRVVKGKVCGMLRKYLPEAYCWEDVDVVEGLGVLERVYDVEVQTVMGFGGLFLGGGLFGMMNRADGPVAGDGGVANFGGTMG